MPEYGVSVRLDEEPLRRYLVTALTETEAADFAVKYVSELLSADIEDPATMSDLDDELTTPGITTRLVTFKVHTPADTAEYDYDNIRKQIGSGTAEIYNDEPLPE